MEELFEAFFFNKFTGTKASTKKEVLSGHF